MRFGGCVSFGASLPSPVASSPWQNLQYFPYATFPAAIDSAVGFTGFLNFAASGFFTLRAGGGGKRHDARGGNREDGHLGHANSSGKT